MMTWIRWLCVVGFLGLVRLGAAEAVPEWQLTDENPNSPRYKAAVSPRDYQFQVSGYYFGSAE